jgi:hypothetical protein
MRKATNEEEDRMSRYVCALCGRDVEFYITPHGVSYVYHAAEDDLVACVERYGPEGMSGTLRSLKEIGLMRPGRQEEVEPKLRLVPPLEIPAPSPQPEGERG